MLLHEGVEGGEQLGHQRSLESSLLMHRAMR
jgi:hypothetical protein